MPVPVFWLWPNDPLASTSQEPPMVDNQTATKTNNFITLFSPYVAHGGGEIRRQPLK